MVLEVLQWRQAAQAWLCRKGRTQSCRASLLNICPPHLILACVCALILTAAQQISPSDSEGYHWAWPEAEQDYWQRPARRQLGSESLEEAEARRLDYTGITWTPAIKVSPPGGGAPALFAGANYTSFQLLSTEPTTNTGRIVMVIPTMNPSAAIAGHCLVEEYGFKDVLPPLTGEGTFTAHQWVSPAPAYDSPPPIKFTQGGELKLCWTEQGQFGIGDGWIIPYPTSLFRVYGALDSCQFPRCMAYRRFFCNQFHSLYAVYLPTGNICDIFIQGAYGPLLYSRLTWAVGTTCATPVGDNLKDGQNYVVGPDNPWVKIVDPLSLIQLGETRRDQDKGFNYRLCYCPAFDSDIDGVCGAYEDFVQQVGNLSGIMASYLNRGSVPVIQTMSITRFSINVDCGQGPFCDTDGQERVKLVKRHWNPYVGTSEDGVFWNTSTTCLDQVEVDAWYSPPNCVNGSGYKQTGGCQMSGGTDAYTKVFGLKDNRPEIRILPLLEAHLSPVAQIFQLCFLHKPSELDGIPAAQWDPTSNAALQGNTRVFWKIAELVVEPLLLYGHDQWVMTQPVTIRVASPDTSRSSNLWGHPTQGPILKLIEENRRQGMYVDQVRCRDDIPIQRDVSGLQCLVPNECTPRADMRNNELVIDNVIVAKSGTYAVCYCEKWPGEADDCTQKEHWTIAGRLQVAGPTGNQEWVMDTDMIQSLYLFGFGFTDENVVKILQEGQDCNSVGFENPESSLCIFREGACLYHGTVTNSTHKADIEGQLRKWNSTNPPAVIQSITRYDNVHSLVNFAEVPVLSPEDIIRFEDNIYSKSTHWVRERDLNRLVRGGDEGHEIMDVVNAGKSALIRFAMDPYPPILQNPPAYGKWWRTTQLKLKWLRGRQKKSQLPVCWGPKKGTYLATAGFINVLDPAFMPRLLMGLTTTQVGATAPVMLSFWTGQNPLYREPRNPTQLRITFMNSSILSLAEADTGASPLGEILQADQQHEASQAVCGRLIREMWSDHEFGFPVPKGCYWDYNRYLSNGRMRAVFIVFEALNGLKALTRYTLVFNMKLHQEMSMEDYANLEDPLIEVTALDDIITKPEGVIEIGRVNPDKPIQAAAFQVPGAPRFLNVTKNETVVGPSLMALLDLAGQEDANSGSPPLLSIAPDSSEVGFTFLLRGDESAPITKGSTMRIILWPLVAWEFNHRSVCAARCFPQQDTICGEAGDNGGWVGCEYEATQSTCRDIVPPEYKQWLDTRGRECKWYAEDRKCVLDGESYTPEHGITAVVACCVCGGGERQNANIVKLSLPLDMDAAFGSQVIHTIKVSSVAPTTKTGFFPTRWGAQLSTDLDQYPHYALTTGAYVMKAPEHGSYDTVATLLGIETWGNNKPFSADKAMNDFYMRLVMPITLFGTAGYGTPSGAVITITLPEGYQCKYVHAAVPKGDGDDAVPMPILPEDPPNGNSALPDSTSGAGNALGFNQSAIIIGVPSGQWQFTENMCIFHFSPYMVLYNGQRVYMHIYAYNPKDPMPFEDVRNFWTINFTSRGDVWQPDYYPTEPPCEGRPYSPPYCNETGEDYYINPRGLPPTVTRSFRKLHPSPDQMFRMSGPFRISDADKDEQNHTWTDRFVVLGRLREIIAQPRDFQLGATTQIMFWFIPDLGSNRGGILSVEFPLGYVVENPCDAHDLPHSYYTKYASPFGANADTWNDPRPLSNTSLAFALAPQVWRLDGILGCSHLSSANTAAISVRGSMVSGRRYGFEIGVTNAAAYDSTAHADAQFQFKLFIRDGLGRPRDGTYTTAVFDPLTTAPKTENGDALRLYAIGVRHPIEILIDEMRPFVWTQVRARIAVMNISFANNTRGRLRITAPPGFNWDLSTYIPNPAGTSRTMPGGVPYIVGGLKPNVIEWGTAAASYEALETYGFESLIVVPPLPSRSSSNKFFLEWGFNETSVSLLQTPSLYGRSAAARADPPPIRAIRGFKVEMASTVVGEESPLWFWFETITHVPSNGSVEFLLPFHDMVFDNEITWVITEGDYCQVMWVEDYLSDPLPSDIRCRRVNFPMAQDENFNLRLEVRIELTALANGIPPGRYVVEFNVTNPRETGEEDGTNTVFYAERNVALDNPCGSRNCWTLYSMTSIQDRDIRLDDNLEWYTNRPPFAQQWQKQNDYWTSIPALRITKRMAFCEIVDMPSPDWLDIRLAIGRNDRPAQRSAVVIAFMLDDYFSEPEDTLDIRAPVGYIFDSLCEFSVNENVYPVAPGTDKTPDGQPIIDGLPSMYKPKNSTSYLKVEEWPVARAPIKKCRGEDHNARVWFGRGLMPKKLYMFRINLQKTPILTPRRNTWMVAYGGESSGQMPGYPVWTFPGSYLDPVSLAWTEKPQPQRSPVILFYQPTNTIFAWTPPLDQRFKLQPLLRIIAPPLYEFLVDAEDQDIQGGDCFSVIQQVGDCRTCGAPYPKEAVSCRREWNRKNVALVQLLGDTRLEAFTWYSVAVTIFNPHIMDSFEATLKPWIFESFLGEPWPVGQPHGYEIDHINVTGYKIAEKAELEVQLAQERNGSAYVPFKQFAFQFTDALNIGDLILLRAPLGYVSTRIIRGLIDQIVCLGYEYNMPAIYRQERDPATGNYSSVFPPVRPPIPDPLPLWANNTAIIETAETVNISNISDTMWEMYNFTVLRHYCLTDRWRMINASDVPNATNEISDGFDWLHPPAGATLNLTVNRNINQTLFPGMVEHCLHARWSYIPPRDIGPDGCDPCCDVTKPPSRINCCNISADIGNSSSEPIVYSCPADQHYWRQLCSLTSEDEMPPGADLMSFRIVPNPHASVFPDVFAGRGKRRDKHGLLPEGAFEADIDEEPPPWASRWSPLRRATGATGNSTSTNATGITTTTMGITTTPCPNGTVLISGNCTYNTTSSTTTTSTTTTTTTTGPDPCYGGIAVEVFWATNVNLFAAMEEHTRKRNAALTLENWDRHPLQVVPSCDGREWTWNITKDSIHPDGPKMLNGTKIFFRLQYQNPRRPPLYHENFWLARHFAVTTHKGPFAGQLQVSSSAAVPSWTIISRLRYVRIEMLSEVLRPQDPAQLHFEFVTVNLANYIKINTSHPEGFNFGDAFMSSPNITERRLASSDEYFDRDGRLGLLPYNTSQSQDDSRQLQAVVDEAGDGDGDDGVDVAFETPYTWKGYTQGIQVIRATNNEVELSCDLARVEYVRFRISGIRIPWQGGQSIFNLFTKMREDDADSIRNCCPPGYPPDNPGYTFMVPYRMDFKMNSLKNEFQQEPLLYPIMSQWETRFDETCIVSFLFHLPHPHTPLVENGLNVLIVRAPPGYQIYDIKYEVKDAAGCQKDSPEDVCGLSRRAVEKIESERSSDSRIELALPTNPVLQANFDYQVSLLVRTPVSLYDRHSPDLASSLWVLELNDAFTLSQNKVSGTLGSPPDFILNNSVNITFEAPDSPPDVVIPVTIQFIDAGEIPPTQVQIYAPLGYKFLPNCLAPGEKERIEDYLVSCRERWSLFGATYLTGAIMMTTNAGLRRDRLPVSVTLLAKTPDVTPPDNKWYTRVKVRTGPTAWGFQMNPFPVRPMNAGVSLTAIAGSEVTLFLSVFFRYPLPWKGRVHVAAPKTYRIHCPVVKVLSGLGGQAPECSEDDPLLAGCWGLPEVTDDPNPELIGIPNCDPRHEILLTFPLPSTTTTTTGEPLTTLPPWAQMYDTTTEVVFWDGGTTSTTTTTTTSALALYALDAGSSMLLALTVEVPMETPTPREENIWRIRVLDASKTSLDGKLNIYGDQIRQVPVVDDFRIWWTNSVPNTVATIVLEFFFNNSRGDLWREDEDVVRVIDIVAPEGLSMAIRRPSDVIPLADDGAVPVANWSWSPIMPRHVWFTLDSSPEKQNFTGRFHFAFPVLTPTKEVGMPLNNLWEIQLCGDQPYCSQLVLRVPIPGFFFGEDAPFELDSATIDKLTGSYGIRAEPLWYVIGGLVVCLSLLRHTLAV